ncbi:MAG: TolC family protein [Bryobacterales bacterium]|nr:TolC family protein [Bryobacterales bacterium]
MTILKGRARAILLFLPIVPAYPQLPMGLADAVERAREHYPSVAVSRSQVEAAAAGIRLARTSYRPRLDSIAQVNRATRNNLYGMLLMQPVISPISGPPVEETSTASVFGSAVGLLFDWEPFDFGLRRAQVELAESARRRTDAAVVRSQFEAGAAAADAYLTVMAARETVKAARAGVERSHVWLKVVQALVRAELRPGADEALAQAELAAAEAQVIQGELAIADATALLAGLTGSTPATLQVDEGRMLAMPEEQTAPGGELAANPLAREQSAAVDEARSRLRTLDKQWVPRFSVQGTSYARGTGARPDFTVLGGANGLAPTFYNWGLGFSVQFPLLENEPVRARQAEQSANIRTEENRYKLILTELETRRNRALAAVDAARRMARLTPTQLAAARTAETQAQARYKAGLASVMEVADTQRLLAQSEIDDGLARLNVWRAVLALRTAEGDLEPFLRMAGN